MNWRPGDLSRGRGRVRLEIEGQTGTLVFDNPEARNAMSVAMMADLVAAVEELEGSDVMAVLMCGAGEGGFCAGGDLRDVRAHLLCEEAAVGMPQVMGDALDRLSSLPVLVVAAVEGAALGGGAELLTAADWVVSSDAARIGFVHAALGVSPGWGGAHRLLRRVGRRSAMSPLLEARRLSASSAHALGLVDQIAPAGCAVDTAKAWIESVLRHPEASVRGAIEILRSAQNRDEAVVRVEREVFSRLWGASAHRAALDGVKAGG